MFKDKIKKLIILNLIIMAFDIFVFSNAFLSINILGGSIMAAAFGITAILMSAVVFIYGNYRILNYRPVLLRDHDIKSLNDCVPAVRQNLDKKTFAGDLNTVLEQIKRFQKKKDTINDILLQKFSDMEMSYSKFKAVVLEVENVIYLNIKSLLNRISAFDEEEYARIVKMKHQPGSQANPQLGSQVILQPGSQANAPLESPASSQSSLQTASQTESREDVIKSKMDIYNHYIAFVKDAVEDNEEIIFKLDRLLFEISKFNSLEDGEIEEMSAMKEIDELIGNAKWYK